MRTQDRKTLGKIFFIVCMVVCLFLAGCKDKSIDHYGQGLDYYNKGEYEHAIAEFTKAIEINSRDAEAYLKRGNAYDHIGEHDLAISEFTKAIEINC
jgi:Flp pilus assembly protein TadD